MLLPLACFERVLRRVAGKQRRVYSACATGAIYVRRKHARARGVLEVFPSGPAGPDRVAAATSATAAAVATGPRLGRPAQPLQADLSGPGQPADSYSGYKILVRTWCGNDADWSRQRILRDLILSKVTGGFGTWITPAGQSVNFVSVFWNSSDYLFLVV